MKEFTRAMQENAMLNKMKRDEEDLRWQMFHKSMLQSNRMLQLVYWTAMYCATNDFSIVHIRQSQSRMDLDTWIYQFIGLMMTLM
jgi:hypothetical protein